MAQKYPAFVCSLILLMSSDIVGVITALFTRACFYFNIKNIKREYTHMEKCQRCIIICAGDLEISQIPLKEDDLVVAVDGGYMYCRVLEITPDVIIGDFDSLEEPYASEVRELEAARVAEPGDRMCHAHRRTVKLRRSNVVA